VPSADPSVSVAGDTPDETPGHVRRGRGETLAARWRIKEESFSWGRAWRGGGNGRELREVRCARIPCPDEGKGRRFQSSVRRR